MLLNLYCVYDRIACNLMQFTFELVCDGMYYMFYLVVVE